MWTKCPPQLLPRWENRVNYTRFIWLQNRVSSSWVVRLLNSFENVLTNKIVWVIVLFWRKKNPYMKSKSGHEWLGFKSMAKAGPIELVGGRDWPMVYEGDLVCMTGGVSLKSIPRSKNRIGESSTCLQNQCLVSNSIIIKPMQSTLTWKTLYCLRSSSRQPLIGS